MVKQVLEKCLILKLQPELKNVDFTPYILAAIFKR
jgi:hypothetical protein